MKKLFFIILIISCALFVVSCDLSSDVDALSRELYEGIRDIADPYLSEAGKKPSTGPTTPSTDGEEGTTVGTEVGNTLPYTLIQVFDENGLAQRHINPSNLGKVTVINFWGTWCHLCLEELPHFNTVASEYSDSVTFVAIHTADGFYSSTNSPVDYVADNFADSQIIFAKDSTLNGEAYEDCYSLFGGYGGYPYTLIIDENGIIAFKISGYLDEATLRAELDKALNG